MRILAISAYSEETNGDHLTAAAADGPAKFIFPAKKLFLDMGLLLGALRITDSVHWNGKWMDFDHFHLFIVY